MMNLVRAIRVPLRLSGACLPTTWPIFAIFRLRGRTGIAVDIALSDASITRQVDLMLPIRPPP